MSDAEIDGVRISSPDKTLAAGITKRDLAAHYQRVATRALPHVVDRPLTLVRCPDGLGDGCFFQKHARPSGPAALGRVSVEERDGPADYYFVRDAAGLVSLAQLAALEVHIGWTRRDRPDRPDRVVFDLDPGDGVSFDDVKDAARAVRARLTDRGLSSFPLLTGGSGIHVVLPVERRHPSSHVRAFAEELAEQMTADEPDRFVATVDRDARRGRIFIDYLRNGTGATAIAPYSPRAKPGLPVATPVRWSELSRVGASAAYPIAKLPRRLGGLGGDPWEGWRSLRQRLPRA